MISWCLRFRLLDASNLTLQCTHFPIWELDFPWLSGTILFSGETSFMQPFEDRLRSNQDIASCLILFSSRLVGVKIEYD